MYTQGIGAAIVIGVVVFLLPALWIAWWKVADLGGGGRGPRAV